MTSAGERVGIGVVGCGVISTVYLQRLGAFETMDVVACADLVIEKAEAQAAAHGVPVACSPEELLADPRVDVVVNLTVPAVHAGLAIAALEAGKSVYTEKPLGLTRDEGRAVLAAASGAGDAVRVGCAPDTFLGAGLQTSRRLLDEGAIGEPLGAAAFVLLPGPESWHPNPEFLYKPGGGPVFDIGVYYLTALVSLLGPITRVSGSARISRAERPMGHPDRRGEIIQVEVPTHVSATVDFASGPVATLVASFDVRASAVPRIEIYGTEGTLSIPDPNTFGGPVRLFNTRSDGWKDIPLDAGFAEQSRGIGVADLVLAIRSGRPHRASGELALHVVDVMQSIHEASSGSIYVVPETTCDRPAPLPVGWDGVTEDG